MAEAGITFLKVNGDQYTVGNSATYDIQETERETLIGASGVAGFKEMFVAPFIECEIFLEPEQDPKAIAAIRGATVVMDLADGRAVQLSSASFVGRGEPNPIDGTMTVRFEGLKGEMIA